MNKKLIITLVILGVLVAGVLIANNVVGNKVADSIDTQLQTILTTDSLDLPFEFEYAEVSSNPLGGSVTVHDFQIVGEEPFMGEGDLKATSVELSMPLSEILAIYNDKELKAVNKMSIAFVDPRFYGEEMEVTFEADYLKLEYDGELSLFELENFENGLLPSTRQSVAFRAKGMKLDAPADFLEAAENNPAVASFIQSRLNQKADFDFSISFDPYKKTLTLDEISSENAFANAHGEGKMEFTGDSVEDFKPKAGEFEIYYDVEAFDTEYASIGRMKLKEANTFIQAEFEMPEEEGYDGANPPLIDITYRANVEKVEFELDQEYQDMIDQSGVPVGSILKLNKFEIDFEKKGNHIDLNTLQLDMDDYVKLDAYFHMEGPDNEAIASFSDLEKTLIKSSRIEISDLSESMQELIDMLEKDMPKPFPREGKKIVIEISGTLADPIIKGVTD